MRYAKPLLLVLWVVLPLKGSTDTLFTIEGKILFQKTGALYVSLCSAAEFNNPQNSAFARIIKPDSLSVSRKWVAFRFDGVRPGTYTVQCFQDVNGNGKLDIGMFGPKEPAGFYKPLGKVLRPPRFEDVCFEIKEPMSGISVILK